MCIYDYSGDYKANLDDDWRDFVETVRQTVERMPPEFGCFSNPTYQHKIAYHVGALDIADVARALRQINT